MKGDHQVGRVNQRALLRAGCGLLRAAGDASVSAARPARATSRTPEELAKAKRYNRTKHLLLLVDLGLSLVGGALFVLSGLPQRVQRFSEQRVAHRLGARTLALALFTLGQFLADLPLDYVSGYTLEQRYQLSNQSRRAWALEQLKGLAIGLPFMALLGNGVLWVVGRWPRRWWLVLTAVSVPFTVLLAQLVPVLILPLFNRFEPLRDAQLGERLKRLAGRSGVHVARVLEMDMSKQTKKANAFFAGLGRTKRIVLADTLIEDFPPAEIEVVVAHEIAHQAHRDIWRFVALGTLMTAASSYAVQHLAGWLLRREPGRLRLRALDQVAALPLLALLSSLVGLVAMPVANAYSRMLERRADRFALDLTRDPRAFVGAMERLARLNLAELEPPALVKYALYSHPPIEERIDYGRRWRAEHAGDAD